MSLDALVVERCAYFDKVVVGIRRGRGRQWLTREEQDALRALQQGRPFHYQEERDHTRYYGRNVTFVRPTADALEYFACLGINHAVRYVEAKVELITESRADAEEIRKQLAQAIWQPYHGKRQASAFGGRHGTSLYFALHHGTGRSGILYVKDSKIAPGCWAVHLECRIQTPASCRRRGIGTVVDLTRDTLSAVLAKDLRFRDVPDRERFEAAVQEHFRLEADRVLRLRRDGGRNGKRAFGEFAYPPRKRRALGKWLSNLELHALAHHSWVDPPPPKNEERDGWISWLPFAAPKRWADVPTLLLQERLPARLFALLTREVDLDLYRTDLRINQYEQIPPPPINPCRMEKISRSNRDNRARPVERGSPSYRALSQGSRSQ